jgi:hypothetical protein
MRKKKIRTDLEEALKDHFRHMYRPITREEWEEFKSDLERGALEGEDPPPPGRGRPAAYDAKDKRTSESYWAAYEIYHHMEEFRRRNKVTRVPAKVMRAIIDDVMSFKPAASEEIILEYIRKNKKHFS